MLAIAVITVSDRAYKREYDDRSGPEIIRILEQSGIPCRVTRDLVPDDKDKLLTCLKQNLDKDYILTTGGTGISPSDITPEITASLCDRELPGISDYIRRESLKETPYAVFSRGYSGIKGRTIIINFPGSVKAATFCTRLVIPVLEHGKKMLQGEGH
jgi:molybdopterin adenylyltransferase